MDIVMEIKVGSIFRRNYTNNGNFCIALFIGNAAETCKFKLKCENDIRVHNFIHLELDRKAVAYAIYGRNGSIDYGWDYLDKDLFEEL